MLDKSGVVENLFSPAMLAGLLPMLNDDDSLKGENTLSDVADNPDLDCKPGVNILGEPPSPTSLNGEKT